MIKTICPESWTFSEQLLFQFMEVLVYNFLGQSLLKSNLRKKNQPVFVNMNLVFLLATCANSFVNNFPDRYVSCLWSLIWSNCVWGSLGKLMLNHWIENDCPEFYKEFLDSYLFKLFLQSHCLELCFLKVAFKTILSQ